MCFMSTKPRNIAYIDGHMGTTSSTPSWVVSLSRFRAYLDRKYNVDEAYYYLGYAREDTKFTALYKTIKRSGFKLVFREHNSAMLGKKKGNVDADIIFAIMKRLYLNEAFNKVVLVSGDGDYKMLVDFLIEQGKFEKILFPNRRFSSSLYKNLSDQYFVYLDDDSVKRKIGLKMKREP